MSCYGVCKTFSPKNGWGFITNSDGKDIFFHTAAVQGRPPQEGDSLTFDQGESRNKPGQVIALNVTGGTAGGNEEGIIRSYDGAHGYGFVEYNGTTLFLHATDVKGNMPLVGDLVYFDVGPSSMDPNKQVALNIVGGTGQPIGKFLAEKQRAEAGLKGAPKGAMGKGAGAKGAFGKGKGKGKSAGSGGGWGGDSWGGDDDMWGMMQNMMGMMNQMMSAKGGKGKGGAAGKGGFGAAGKGGAAAAGPYGKGGKKGAKGW